MHDTRAQHANIDSDMAPARKRPSIRARAVTSTRQTKPSASVSSPESSVRPANKKDKRTAKHETLLQRIREGGVRKTKLRRPSRKLRAAEDVKDLRDALPDVKEDEEEEEDEEEGWEGVSDVHDEQTSQVTNRTVASQRRRRRPVSTSNGGAKIVMKSMQHRPGAMKRKRKLEQSEMERFSKNLAQLSGSDVNSKDRAMADAVSAGDKWAALRRFIGGTMEKDKAFAMG